MSPPRLPDRLPWGVFPDVVLHAPVHDVKHHATYVAAKSGDAVAATELVRATISDPALARLQDVVRGREPILVAVHAVEETGVNAIPERLADLLAVRLGLTVDTSLVQTNVVGHTGATGFARLARQAMFDGDVAAGRDYLMVDDFIGQGGTFANLRGYVEKRGGRVLGATALTGKGHSVVLALSAATLDDLRRKHGTELEDYWLDRFGHALDCLTESEARYLARTADAVTIRDRIAAAEQAGDRGAGTGPVE